MDFFVYLIKSLLLWQVCLNQSSPWRRRHPKKKIDHNWFET